MEVQEAIDRDLPNVATFDPLQEQQRRLQVQLCWKLRRQTDRFSPLWTDGTGHWMK